MSPNLNLFTLIISQMIRIVFIQILVLRFFYCHALFSSPTATLTPYETVDSPLPCYSSVFQFIIKELFALHKTDTQYLVPRLSGTKLDWLLRDFFNSMMYCDNKSAFQIAHNSVFHERVKHTEINCHHTHHHFQHKILIWSFVHFSKQIAKLFAKVTPISVFQIFGW